MNERRKLNRKDFTYYMRLFDYDTQELVGHLSDISTGGFKVDSRDPVQANKVIRLRMDLSDEIANKPYMMFTARARWCQPHPLDPTLFNVGFQIISIKPGDFDILNRMVQNYGTEIKKDGPKRFGNKW